MGHRLAVSLAADLKEFSSFEELLDNIREVSSNYRDFKKRVLNYDISNSYVVDKYIEIIEEVGHA